MNDERINSCFGLVCEIGKTDPEAAIEITTMRTAFEEVHRVRVVLYSSKGAFVATDECLLHALEAANKKRLVAP